MWSPFKFNSYNDLETFQSESNETLEDNEEEDVFPCHEILGERFRRTLYYGATLPSRDRPSLSMSELLVEKFVEGSSKNDNVLTMTKASVLSKKVAASPTSLLLALLYLERIKKLNRDFLSSLSSTDIFIVTAMVASKYLIDEGESDAIFNEEWAEFSGKSKKDLNRLELQFLSAIEWNVYIDPSEFTAIQFKVEYEIAKKHVLSRGWASYTDLLLLSTNSDWRSIFQSTLKIYLLLSSSYIASFLSLMGAIIIMSKNPLVHSLAYSSNSLSLHSTPNCSNFGVFEIENEKIELVFDDDDDDSVFQHQKYFETNSLSLPKAYIDLTSIQLNSKSVRSPPLFDSTPLLDSTQLDSTQLHLTPYYYYSSYYYVFCNITNPQQSLTFVREI